MEIETEEKVSKKALPLRILKSSFRVPLILLLVLVIAVFVGSSFFMTKYPNALSFIGITGNQELAAQQQNEKTLAAVSVLMNLPDDEQPTIATVTDVDLIKDQPFFNDAQNGDVVLIYPNARKAILYRASENRIIEVGAVNINQENQVEISGDESEKVQEETEVEGLPSPTSTPVSTSTPIPTPKETEEVVE